jgi:hypothetical protein
MPLVNGIQIYDLQRGTVLRSYSGLDVANVPGPHIAIDDSGQTLYVISSSGLQVIKLDSVPLSIGHATPSVGPSGGGTSVTIRGSGFQSGTQVTIGTVPVSSVFVDSNTLRVVTPPLPPGRVRMSVSNPDGQRYDLDVAFQLN